MEMDFFLKTNSNKSGRKNGRKHCNSFSFAESGRWSSSMSASHRVLIILIENGGVDLGIPELVDRIFSAINTRIPIPAAARTIAVNFLREKITSFTDSLIETAELTLNRYTAATPDTFGSIVVLRNGTATYTELKNALIRHTNENKIMDVMILTHGNSDSIAVTGNINGQKIREIKTEAGRPLSIRSVYMMNCVGSSLNQAWIDAGAKVSSGSIRNNYLPEPTTFFFWNNWKDGQNFETAVIGAYRKTIKLMNDAVNAALSNIPVLSSIAGTVNFENMDFVRDSAPVIQGLRSATINMDDLTFSQSQSRSDLATTVLPVSFLQSLPVSRSFTNERTQTWNASQQCIDLIKSFEGFRANKYNDPVGHCTIGYGTLLHQGNCNNSDPSELPYASGITEAQATQLLVDRMNEFQRTINDSVTVELNQNQYDSLVSLAYNIGSGNFRSSTLLRILNTGNYAGVPAEIRRWTKGRVNGQLVDLPGLVTRRNREATLFTTPVTAAQQSLFGNSLSLNAFGFSEPPAGRVKHVETDEQEGEVDVQLPGLTMSLSIPAYCTLNPAADASSPNFSLNEFRCHDAAQTPVPVDLRGNVQRLMNQLEVLRTALGVPIRINSGYRTPEYNATLSGAATSSQHMCGMASDITATGFTPLQIRDKIEELIGNGTMLQGGLGLYNSFVHYDIRGTRARWDNRTGTSTAKSMSVYSKPLYDTGEHAILGEFINTAISGPLANVHALLPTTTYSVNTVPFTYGQIITLGDFYENYTNCQSANPAELNRLKVLITRSEDHYKNTILGIGGRTGDVGTDDWSSPTRGIGSRYIDLALANNSHFAPPPSGTTSRLTNNKASWESYHNQAIRAARTGTNSDDLDIAYPINAFGDHFLTDAFSAGHLINKEQVMNRFIANVTTSGRVNAAGARMLERIADGALAIPAINSKLGRFEVVSDHWYEPNWDLNDTGTFYPEVFYRVLKAVMEDTANNGAQQIANLAVKAVHDYLNNYQTGGVKGVPVRNNKGNSWNLTGDGTLNPANIQIIQLAVKQSVLNIEDSITNGSTPVATFYQRVWDYVPDLNHPATRTVVDNAITTFTTPSSGDLITKAVSLIGTELDTLLNKLLAAGRIRCIRRHGATSVAECERP